MRSARRRKVETITHPIFSLCASFTEDPEWKELYIQASYGKLPKHFIYSNNVLCYRKTASNCKQVTLCGEPYDIFNQSIQFFREHGVMSSLDRTLIAQMQEDEDLPNGIMPLETITKKPKKVAIYIEMILQRFAKQYCDRHNIPRSYNTLYKTLVQAYRNKCLNDVEVHEGEVVNIIGLSHTPDGKIVYTPMFHPKQHKSKFVPIIETVDPNFSIRDRESPELDKNWVQFLRLRGMVKTPSKTNNNQRTETSFISE